ncbi:MAG TPA: ABC transporter substrate-binding protein [Candidatus Angelobacter sp.]|jgi:ABC-type branched-subunit amino acid transport system substrate-binding protein
MVLQRVQFFWRAFWRVALGVGLLMPVSTPAFSATPLTRQEACGKKIYFEGTDCAGKEIKGAIGDLQVSAKLQPCASCHGADGKGRAENGQDPGDITWQYLSVPYGHRHANGRKHPVFTAALFERAVTTGRDPAGGKLSELMPRFRMSPVSSAELVAYLKKISTETDAGVEPTRLLIGNLSPAQGANAETGSVVQDVLTAYFADLNQRGGIYGRQISLRFADSGDDSATTIKDAKQLAAAPVFAMVAPFVPDAEKSLAAMAHASHIPIVGLMALSVPDEPANREVFYLLPGFEQLEQDLVRFSAVRFSTVSTEKTAVVVADTKLEADVSSYMEATWKELGVSKPREFSLSSENSQEIIHQLKSQGIETVFFVGEGAQASQWIQAADQAEWSPAVFVLGPLMDGSILAEPARFQGKIFAAYPLLQPELGAVDQFEDFLQRHKFSHEHRLVQISAYCAAKILEDALVRAGRNVTREKLILSLEQLRDFKTGLLPGITYGANRHIGSFKTEIVCVDLVSHSFQPECSKPQTPE